MSEQTTHGSCGAYAHIRENPMSLAHALSQLVRSISVVYPPWPEGREKMNDPVLAHVSKLKDIEDALRYAYTQAEKSYRPQVLNLWRMMEAHIDLWRAKRLRIYEFFPLYWVLSFGAGAVAVGSGRPWLLAVYALTLLPAIFCSHKYVEQFTSHRSKVDGLPRSAFGIPNLPLIVHGFLQIYPDPLFWRRGRAPSPLTRDTLGAIIKLIKLSHEHNEISHGVTEWARKWVFGVPLGVMTYAVVHSSEFNRGAEQLFAFVSQHHRASITIAALLVPAAVYIVQYLVFTSVAEKKTRRRYLLALNALHECWSPEIEQALGSRGQTEPPAADPADDAPRTNLPKSAPVAQNLRLTLVPEPDSDDGAPQPLSLSSYYFGPYTEQEGCEKTSPGAATR